MYKNKKIIEIIKKYEKNIIDYLKNGDSSHRLLDIVKEYKTQLPSFYSKIDIWPLYDADVIVNFNTEIVLCRRWDNEVYYKLLLSKPYYDENVFLDFIESHKLLKKHKQTNEYDYYKNINSLVEEIEARKDESKIDKLIRSKKIEVIDAMSPIWNLALFFIGLSILKLEDLIKNGYLKRRKENIHLHLDQLFFESEHYRSVIEEIFDIAVPENFYVVEKYLYLIKKKSPKALANKRINTIRAYFSIIEDDNCLKKYRYSYPRKNIMKWLRLVDKSEIERDLNSINDTKLTYGYKILYKTIKYL